MTKQWPKVHHDTDANIRYHPIGRPGFVRADENRGRNHSEQRDEDRADEEVHKENESQSEKDYERSTNKSDDSQRDQGHSYLPPIGVADGRLRNQVTDHKVTATKCH